MSKKVSTIYSILTIIFLVFFIASCLPACSPIFGDSSGATTPQKTPDSTAKVDLISQTIVPSYGNYEGGILYHYFDYSTNQNVYIFNGTNKSAVGLK